MHRWRVAAVVAALGAAALVLSVVAYSRGSDTRDVIVFGRTSEYRGAELLPSLRRPQFMLVDTAGQQYEFERSTRGKLTLLFFGYTNCPDICPTTMATIALALKGLRPEDAAGITVVFVTTDPKRDSPAALRTWLDAVDPAFVGLTGEQGAVNDALALVRLPESTTTEVTEAGYLVNHVSEVLVFTPDDIAHLVYSAETSAEDWQHDLAKLANEGWHKPKR